MFGYCIVKNCCKKCVTYLLNCLEIFYFISNMIKYLKPTFFKYNKNILFFQKLFLFIYLNKTLSILLLNKITIHHLYQLNIIKQYINIQNNLQTTKNN